MKYWPNLLMIEVVPIHSSILILSVNKDPKEYKDNILFYFYGPVLRATFFFNLSRNIVALQVETHCCAYYRVCDQLVSQQNTVLQVEAICCAK